MEVRKASYKTYFLFFNRRFIFERMDVRTYVKGFKISKGGYMLYTPGEKVFAEECIGLFKGLRIWLFTYSCFIGFSTNKIP